MGFEVSDMGFEASQMTLKCHMDLQASQMGFKTSPTLYLHSSWSFEAIPTPHALILEFSKLLADLDYLVIVV